MDVRLNNRSQLAGFAKRDDLKYFARTLCGMDYEHWPEHASAQLVEWLNFFSPGNHDDRTIIVLW